MAEIGYVVALVSALAAGTLIAVLPFLTAGLRPNERRGSTFWPLCGSVAVILFAGAHVQAARLDGVATLAAMAYSGAVLLGLAVEWVREVIRTRGLAAAELVIALLLTSVGAIAVRGWLDPRLGAASLAGCFAAGLMLQAACHLVFGGSAERRHRRFDSPDLGVSRCHRPLWERNPRRPAP